MEKYFRDTIIQFDQGILDINENIFDKILTERENGIDSKRFFLAYLPAESLQHYNFDDHNHLKKFRNDCLGIDSPLMDMGGCNLHPKFLERDKKSGCLRYAGIKMSDPYGKIFGSFDIRDGIVTYSPLFPHFYEERDLCKYANDKYFTTMKFEDIMLVQIDKENEYFVHVGNSYKIGVPSDYILEKVTKDEMIKFVFEPEEGEKIYKRALKCNQKK